MVFMNKNILDYLSSLSKEEVKDFNLPNTQTFVPTNLIGKQIVKLNELPQPKLVLDSIERNIEFVPVGEPPEWLKKAVKERDNYKCVRCGLEEDRQVGIYLHVDHAIPRIKGGQNAMENLQTMCYNCNVLWKGEEVWFGPTLKEIK